MRKYEELNSIDRANYWNLMNVLDVIDEYGGNLARANDARESIEYLCEYLNKELFTDDEYNWGDEED